MCQGDEGCGSMSCTYNPDSATIVRNSCAIYLTGLPCGGESRNCTLDFTTSAHIVSKERGANSETGCAHQVDRKIANMQADGGKIT